MTIGLVTPVPFAGAQGTAAKVTSAKTTDSNRILRGLQLPSTGTGGATASSKSTTSSTTVVDSLRLADKTGAKTGIKVGTTGTGTTGARTTNEAKTNTTEAERLEAVRRGTVSSLLGATAKTSAPQPQVHLLSSGASSGDIGAIKLGTTNAVQVPLKLDDLDVAKMRVLSPQTQKWEGITSLTGTIGQPPSVTVPKGGSVVVAPTPDQGIVTRLLSRSGTSFPGAIIKARENPGGGASVELISLNVEPITWPMTWDTALGKYVTRLRVLLKQGDKDAEPDHDLTVRFSARYAEIAPLEVTVRAHEAPTQHLVTVTTGRHEPTPEVTAESPLGTVRNKLEVDVGLPTLRLSAGDSELDGFGLESTQVTITSVADDGIELVGSAPLTVNLTTNLGTLDPASVVIPAGASHTTVTLRSSGTGAAQLTAAGRAGRTELTVRFGFPTTLLLLLVVGGTLGGALHWMRGKARATASLRMLVLEGLLVGPILVIALLAGASLAGFGAAKLLATDIGRFTLAVVFGFVGTPAVDALRRQIFKGDDETDDDKTGAAGGDASASTGRKRRRANGKSRRSPPTAPSTGPSS